LLAMEELLCLKEDSTLTLQWHLPVWFSSAVSRYIYRSVTAVCSVSGRELQLEICL
jgi:hypothetical protein